MEEHGVIRDGVKWVGFYQEEREGRTLILHAYEVAGAQWSHGYQLFLYEKGDLKLLHESKPIYPRRDKAFEEGKLFAKDYRFKRKSRLFGLLRKIASL